MNLHVFAIRDTAAVTYGRPFFVPSKAVAIRSFTDEVNRPAEDNQFYKHADDFHLYYLGHFDDESGRFSSFDDPELVVRAKDLLLELTPSE